MIPQLNLTTSDWLIVLASVAIAVYVGIRANRRMKSGTQGAVDYVLAGRSLTAPLFAASLIATWYGAVFGAAEFVVRYGVVMILCFGVPYYLVGIVYAQFIARRMRSSSTLSIPHQIRVRYGAIAGFVAVGVLLVVSIPAPYILTIGYLISSMSGLPLAVSIAAGTTVSLLIVAKGGLRSDVHANVVHVILMYVAFAVLAIFCVITFGSPSTMLADLPSRALDVPGSIGWAGIAVWGVIALQTFIDPNFQVRVAASVNPDTARKGILASVAGWIVFDGLQLMIGLYAVAYGNVADPSQSLLSIAQIALPPVWKGLFISGVIAAVISTLDGYALVSATMIGHDLIDGIRGKDHRRSSLIIGLLSTGLIGSLAALLVPSIVDLLMYAASIAVPGILIPLVVSYWPQPLAKPHARISAWLWIVIPSAASLIGVVLQLREIITIEPMFVGLITSVVMFPFVDRSDNGKG